ncbi:MAG: isopentenyldiphosphate isomerase [Flavobacteriaceae bacterium]|jgi:isopentenyldiphosphate isomerase
MEYIDILNERGEKTGEIKSKEQVHIDGDWHRAVHVWIVNSSNEVLLQKRAKTKINYPDMWDISAAGHVSVGEGSVFSSLREIEEEIGVIVDEKELVFIGELISSSIQNNGTYINNEFNDVYLIKKDIPLEDMVKQDSEVDDLKYVSIEEFKEWIKNNNPDLVNHDEEFNLFFDSL